MTPNQERGMRRNGVELVVLEVRVNTGINPTSSRVEMEQFDNLGKEKTVGDELIANTPVDRKGHKISRDGTGRLKSKRKRYRGLNSDTTDESPARVVKRELLESASPFKVVAGDQPRQEP